MLLNLNAFVQKIIQAKTKTRSFYTLVLFSGMHLFSFGQITATHTSSPNLLCNGYGCDYQGPSILINELMISPTSNDGSISGAGGATTGRGEWIELYNPNLCQPVDISCYYLGNNTPDGYGGYIIPAGTIIPPAGFCLIRGRNMPAVPVNLLVQNGGKVVELVVPYNVSDAGVCAGGSRVWFPNAGGWFAFYDRNGVPQDAVSWGNQANVSGSPCVANLGGCTPVASLASYNNIPADRKFRVSTVDATVHQGQSLRRGVDGGAWNSYGPDTYATCNSTCAVVGSSTCEGSATVNPSGGTPPYTYSWNDSEGQLTQTATALCAGTYQVTVTDDLGAFQAFTVIVEDYKPPTTVQIADQICIDGGIVTTAISPAAGANETGVLSGPGISGTNFNPLTAGAGTHTISYVFTDENGCTNTVTDNIIVSPLPVVNIAGFAPSYCLSTNPVVPTLTPAGGTLTGPGVSNNTFISAIAGVGTHTLTYTYTDANACTNTTTVTVTVFAPPAPVFVVQDSICDYKTPIVLSGTPAGGIFTVDGVAITAFNPADYAQGIHTIVYTVTDQNGCMATTNDQIKVLPRPALSSNLAANYCFDSNIINLTFTPPGGILTGDFATGTTLNLTAALPGDYDISYFFTDNKGCENTLDQTYNVTTPIHPAFKYTTDCFQNAMFVNATIPFQTNYQFSWDFYENGTSNQVHPTQYYAVHGNHNVKLTVRDIYNCTYDTVQPIFVKEGANPSTFFIPNVITPNNDGVNDFLALPALVDNCIQYKMIILNRWGNVVYEMTSSDDAFKGKDKGGKELAEGVYFYLIESDDIDCNSAQYKGFCSGTVTIER